MSKPIPFAAEMTTRDVERAASLPVPRLSWGAIFGGAVAALGLRILLYALGVALGLSSINPDNPESAQASGLFYRHLVSSGSADCSLSV
ncbi:MAG: hypothetical protein ACT4TC_14060 [Myxococcaceae bacterium]